MSTIKSFEDLEIWILSRELVKNIYSDFKGCKDYNFYNQITSAGLSIMNNSAEGFGRESIQIIINSITKLKHYLKKTGETRYVLQPDKKTSRQ